MWVISAYQCLSVLGADSIFSPSLSDCFRYYNSDLLLESRNFSPLGLGYTWWVSNNLVFPNDAHRLKHAVQRVKACGEDHPVVHFPTKYPHVLWYLAGLSLVCTFHLLVVFIFTIKGALKSRKLRITEKVRSFSLKAWRSAQQIWYKVLGG